MGTGPELSPDVDDEVGADPKDVPALRFHRFLDLRYCTTNSLISLYVVRLAEFIAIWGAKALGATSGRIASLRSWSNCFEYSRSYFAISPSHSSRPHCH